MSRESEWTTICWDIDKTSNTWKAHVRLVPSMLDTDATGRPWGFSIGNINFANEKEANDFADQVDAFMNKMKEAIIEDYEEEMAADAHFNCSRG